MNADIEAALAVLEEADDRATPAPWRSQVFPSGQGGIWHGSSPGGAAVLTCPAAKGDDLALVALLRNAAPAVMRLARASADFKHWGEKITAYVQGAPKEAGTDDWAHHLKAARDAVDAALDELAEAILGNTP